MAVFGFLRFRVHHTRDTTTLRDFKDPSLHHEFLLDFDDAASLIRTALLYSEAFQFSFCETIDECTLIDGNPDIKVKY